MATTIYYLIDKKILGKREGERLHMRSYLFIEGKWEPDRKSVIMDHLMGYDSSEPEGSPYAFGSLDAMDGIEEISEKRAKALMHEQAVNTLIEQLRHS